MDNSLQYTSVYRIISKIYRDTNQADIDESDLIEWIGEALEFIKAPEVFQHNVAFLRVQGYETDIPKGFKMVTQLAKYNGKPEKKYVYEMPCMLREELERNRCRAEDTSTIITIEEKKWRHFFPVQEFAHPLYFYIGTEDKLVFQGRDFMFDTQAECQAHGLYISDVEFPMIPKPDGTSERATNGFLKSRHHTGACPPVTARSIYEICSVCKEVIVPRQEVRTTRAVAPVTPVVPATPDPCNCEKEPIDILEREKFYFDTPYLYNALIAAPLYRENFSPIRLANHTFFNTLVCKEKDQSPYELHRNPYGGYNKTNEEYTLVGTAEKKIRFSFKEGHVALSYVKNAIDEETGYPLVPDNVYCISAIGYYVKWKMAEMYAWNGREGYDKLAQQYQVSWLRYIKMAKNDLKMPKSLDQLQNMLEQTHHLIPRHNMYYGFFGNLGRRENRSFNDPEGRRMNRFLNP